MDSKAQDAQVAANMAEGRALGINATPTSYINGRKLELVSREDGGNPGDAVRVAEDLRLLRRAQRGRPDLWDQVADAPPERRRVEVGAEHHPVRAEALGEVGVTSVDLTRKIRREGIDEVPDAAAGETVDDADAVTLRSVGGLDEFFSNAASLIDGNRKAQSDAA